MKFFLYRFFFLMFSPGNLCSEDLRGISAVVQCDTIIFFLWLIKFLNLVTSYNAKGSSSKSRQKTVMRVTLSSSFHGSFFYPIYWDSNSGTSHIPIQPSAAWARPEGLLRESLSYFIWIINARWILVKLLQSDHINIDFFHPPQKKKKKKRERDGKMTG